MTLNLAARADDIIIIIIIMNPRDYTKLSGEGPVAQWLGQRFALSNSFPCLFTQIPLGRGFESSLCHLPGVLWGFPMAAGSGS